MSRAGLSAPEATSALSRLLDTEARLEAMVAEARERADAVVREAESRCSARLAAVDAELRDALAAARSRHAGECAARIALLERESEAALRRYEAVAGERAEELARWLANQVLREMGAESTP